MLITVKTLKTHRKVKQLHEKILLTLGSGSHDKLSTRLNHRIPVNQTQFIIENKHKCQDRFPRSSIFTGILVIKAREWPNYVKVDRNFSCIRNDCQSRSLGAIPIDLPPS